MEVTFTRAQSRFPWISCWFSLVVAAAEAVTSINMSRNCLLPQHAVALEKQLRKFLSLKHLDLSGNAGLDSGAVAVIVKALAGEAARFFFIVHGSARCMTPFFRGPRVC